MGTHTQRRNPSTHITLIHLFSRFRLRKCTLAMVETCFFHRVELLKAGALASESISRLCSMSSRDLVSPSSCACCEWNTL